MSGRFDYHRPRALEEAQDLKTSIPGSRYIAGGTDLLLRMKNGHEHPPALISLRGIPGLAGATGEAETHLGAMTTFTEIAEDGALCGRYPVLRQAVRRIGCVQIRNVATVGGNLCNAIPCADSALALLVLDASLRIQGRADVREVTLDRFFLGPRQTCLEEEDILVSVRIPFPDPAGRGVFLKKTRVHRDLALASVAVFLSLSEDGRRCRRARVAAGSVAPTPRRLRKVEGALEGREITAEVLDRAAALARDAIAPISDVRASADYRREITGVLLRRAVASLIDGRPA